MTNSTTMKRYSFPLIVILLLLGAGCTNVWDEHTKLNDNVLQETILDYLEAHDQFSTFTALLKNSGMDGYLGSSGIYTVWAPDNQAMAEVPASLTSSPEKVWLFVSNHIISGMYSSLENNPPMKLKMKSGKMLYYDSGNEQIDGVGIHTLEEVSLKNGVVQVVAQALSPRYSIWDYLKLEAPPGRFVDYMKSLPKMVLDAYNSPQTGVNEFNQPVYDSIWIEQNRFFLTVTDLSAEDSSLTLLIPGDEDFDAEFNKYEKYFRRDDKMSNEIPTARDSAYIKLMIARDLVFPFAYTGDTAPDTLYSYFGVKVPFNRSSRTASFVASNGYVHHVSDCRVEVAHKILPVVMEAENCIANVILTASGSYLSNTTSGTATPYFRQRPNASQGYDLIVDNSHKSEKLSGALFVGPVLASIRYRVKIRAINDFNKSYRYPNAEVDLAQWLGQVTITRDPLTEQIKAISTATNLLNSGTQYGTPDVIYDPADPATYYVPVSLMEYSAIEEASNDEIDLGYYNFTKSDSVFLRLIPQSAQMAVTADYFRLEPIFESTEN